MASDRFERECVNESGMTWWNNDYDKVVVLTPFRQQHWHIRHFPIYNLIASYYIINQIRRLADTLYLKICRDERRLKQKQTKNYLDISHLTGSKSHL